MTVNKRPRELQQAAMVLIEDPGDDYHKPEAIVFFDMTDQMTIICQDARYNFIQSILHRFDLDQMFKEGVRYRGHHVELKELDADVMQNNSSIFQPTINDIIVKLYRRNPRQMWFLERYVEEAGAK